jgi:S1-C subfamily serine protease
MAIIKMEGSNFIPAPLRPGTESSIPIEKTVILGYPLGTRLSGGGSSQLRLSNFAGRVASVQETGGLRRVYIDSTGLHGNSGSPTFGEDGRVIGVFSGSIIPGGKGNLDELNYFYPIDYLFSCFTE